MAAITERNGRFLVRVRRQGYKLAAKTFHNRRDAERWGRQVEVLMERGDWRDETPVKVPTLREAIQEYRRVVAVHFKGIEDYDYRYDLFETTSFAAKPIDEVTPADLAAWRDDHARGRKAATVARLLAMWSGIFRWAQRERGWIVTNPLSIVSRPRVNDARDRTLTDAELVYLMRAAVTSKARWFAPALVVLLRSAMRRSELFSMGINDVDLVAGLARLHDSKNGEPRCVPLCQRAREAMGHLIALAKTERRETLIPVGAIGSVSTRFLVTVGRAKAAYITECHASGSDPAPGFLENLRLHDIRHQAVTSWAATGALTIFELQKISGHRDVRMLNRYVNIKPADLASKLSQLTSAQ